VMRTNRARTQMSIRTKVGLNRTLEDVTCDLCSASCKCGPTYEFMTLKASWGLNSGNYPEDWNAYICERCVQEKLPEINFKKTSRMFQP
jgi:hypothetical protein